MDFEADKPKEECGVVGIFVPEREAGRLAFFGLFALQHRGQESAGIAVGDGSRVRMHRDMGLVANVFNEEILKTLPGHVAVGHTRYSTTGPSVLRNAQPIYCQSLVGEIAVAHNGNLINAIELRREMEATGERFDSTSDTEVIARILVQMLPEGPEKAVAEVMRRCKGAYSCTVLTPNMVIGFRDPNGVRPMAIGKIGSDGFAIVSESCAFAPMGAEMIRELEPGEMAIIDHGQLRIARGAESPRKSMCMFEFIYFARPDSEMYGTMLYTARERMGENLAKEHPVDADVVIPVPDSGIPAALGYAKESGIPFREGMTKSRYIHRTFIAPDPEIRALGVRLKLSPLTPHVKDQRVILVDDSIVRATTTGQIVKLMFLAGAKEVHVRITAPPIMWPCFYGIDMATRKELAAATMTLEEIREHIGATSLGYLSIPGVVSAVGRPEDEFCLACFSGKYPIPVQTEVGRDPFSITPKSDVGGMAAVDRMQPDLFES